MPRSKTASRGCHPRSRTMIRRLWFAPPGPGRRMKASILPASARLARSTMRGTHLPGSRSPSCHRAASRRARSHRRDARDGSSAVVPVWILDRVACAAVSGGPPRGSRGDCRPPTSAGPSSSVGTEGPATARGLLSFAKPPAAADLSGDLPRSSAAWCAPRSRSCSHTVTPMRGP